MKKLTGFSVGLCLIFSGLMSSFAAAQDGTGASTAPPKVLVIQREVLKPGRAGNTHVKTESAFVQAMTAAKWPTHYFAAESMSGVSRALFFVGYPSFAAWEKDNEAMAKNATLTSAFDHAALVDGDLLTEFSSGAFVYNEEGSFNGSKGDIPHMRYFEISQFRVKPGHEKEWDDLVKMYKSAYEKALPNGKWALFDSMYGVDNGGLHLVFVPMKSLSEVDQNMMDEKKFMAAVGEDGMKKISELTASCLQSSQSNLFAFSPKMSYPPDEWVKADPGFWKPKMAAPAPAKKTAE